MKKKFIIGSIVTAVVLAAFFTMIFFMKLSKDNLDKELASFKDSLTKSMSGYESDSPMSIEVFTRSSGFTILGGKNYLDFEITADRTNTSSEHSNYEYAEFLRKKCVEALSGDGTNKIKKNLNNHSAIIVRIRAMNKEYPSIKDNLDLSFRNSFTDIGNGGRNESFDPFSDKLFDKVFIQNNQNYLDMNDILNFSEVSGLAVENINEIDISEYEFDRFVNLKLLHITDFFSTDPDAENKIKSQLPDDCEFETVWNMKETIDSIGNY